MVEFRWHTNIKHPHPKGLFVTGLPPAVGLMIVIGGAMLVTWILTGRVDSSKKDPQTGAAMSLHQLCGDYAIGRRDGWIVRIWNKKTDEIAIGGDVGTFAIKPPYVTGICTDTPDPMGKSVPGFYLLNTATGERMQGLPAGQWGIELKKINWENPRESDVNDPM